MIRFVKYLSRENILRFKGGVPAYSCVISIYSIRDTLPKIYPLNTDKVYNINLDSPLCAAEVTELLDFIMAVHDRRGSNTTCYSEHYTVAKFLSDNLEIQRGRFTVESNESVDLEMGLYDLLEKSYKIYVLGGIIP